MYDEGGLSRAERELGIEPEYVTRVEDDFRPNPVDEAERARRMREAALRFDGVGIDFILRERILLGEVLGRNRHRHFRAVPHRPDRSSPARHYRAVRDAGQRCWTQ